MKTKRALLVLACSLGLLAYTSCQDDKRNEAGEVEILPQEELNEGDRPMPRSYMLAKMRENDELSSFTEELQNSGLEEEFEGKEGIYTFFAPSNAAYDRIPAKELGEDVHAESGESKKNHMRYYMVEGELTPGYLLEKIRASEDGRYEFETVLGEKLWATEEDGKIVLIDVLGNKAKILVSELEEYRGAYHIIDNVLQPGENENVDENEM